MMSNYSFSIRRTGDLLRVAFVILLPLAIIVLQNDTGSGVVLCSFLFVLYREGLNKWICIPIILVAALFIFSFLFTPLFLLALLVIIFTVSDAMMIGAWRAHAVFLASVTLASALLYLVSGGGAQCIRLRRHRDGSSGSGGRGICPAQEYLGHLRDAGTLRRVDDLRAYGRHDLRDDPPAPPA
jgi:cell division protein FtsW (lipid II flippase)